MQHWRRAIAVFLVVGSSAVVGYAELSDGGQAPSVLAPEMVDVPGGTGLSFLFLRAAYARTAKAGDPLYMQTTYPVTVGSGMAIPAGSFLQGTLQASTKPTRKSSHAMVTVSFEKLVLPNGYAVLMHEVQTLDVQVSSASDVLLDSGTQAEIKLAAPLQLNAKRVEASLAAARPVKPGSVLSSTHCVPTPGTPGSPGTPGTPDITIPGNPGTPDTVIPGSNGAPDTVIPGIPATPPTVIAGSPGTPGDSGTPGTYCAAPPLVVGSTAVKTGSNATGSPEEM